jgi:hypothetical protein
MTNDEGIKKMSERLEADGIATAQVANGRLIAIHKSKLLELLAQIEKSGADAGMILIKDPDKVN